MSNLILMNRRYADAEAIDNVINYCHSKCFDWWGMGVDLASTKSAINTMKFVKKVYGKETCKQLEHMVICVTPYDDGRELSSTESKRYCAEMRKFADTISRAYYAEGYQNCYFYHVRPSDNVPHIHYVINTTSVYDGKQMPNYTSLGYQVHDYLKTEYPHMNWRGVNFNTSEG